MCVDPAHYIETSLGPWAVREGPEWVLDLTQLPLLHGLSVLAKALGEMVIEQAHGERVDIDVERRIRPDENPELAGELDLRLVKVCAELPLARRLAEDPELLQHNLRCILGTLQRQRYREALLPPDPHALATALLFELEGPRGRGPARYLLECLPAPPGGTGRSLRISVEDPAGRRLDLGSIAHLPVLELEQRSFIAGATRFAQGWREGIRRSAELGRSSYLEPRKPYSRLFRQFDRIGLEALEQLHITWEDPFLPRLFESEASELDALLKKVLLTLEDRALRGILEQRLPLRLLDAADLVYLELTHLGRVLHVCLGHHPTSLDVEDFLARMPACAAIAGRGYAPLAEVEVFLVHHMTAEILGLIAALRRLGCRRLTVLFVTYAGETPGEYLRPLLDLPQDEFRALALRNVHDARSVEGRYVLSGQYSTLENREQLEHALQRPGLRYIDAMQTVARIEFLRLIRAARAAGRKALLIEDGGYLAPGINRACLEGLSAGQYLAAADPGCTDARALSGLLAGTFLGSVEHTRNGHERLSEVVDEHGELAFPAFSIAVSHLKRRIESREVASSILSAIESVLHATGLVLGRRRCLVLGSRGAIGRHLFTALRARLERPAESLCGIDLVCDEEASELEKRFYRELPEELRLGLDLVIGVTGTSVLAGGDMEEWLLHGRSPRLVLASGSTKTEEFRAVMAWLDALLAAEDPLVGEHPVRISAREVNDPQTGKFFGHAYDFEFTGESGQRTRTLICLANLTPVNFLFYGVPTEVIDEVLAELLSASLGLLARSRRGAVAPLLHSVDREIDRDGEALQ